MGGTGFVFTSESVTCGHPDKLCDHISDAILDACLTLDPNSKVAVETLVKGTPEKSYVVLAGEVRIGEGISPPDYEAIARETAIAIGYDNHIIGMDASSSDLCQVDIRITTQSAHINRGVIQAAEEQGAGDQGLMFGYASDETEAYDNLKGRYMPLPIALAQCLSRQLKEKREDGTLPWSRPDGKSQVTVRYDADGSPEVLDHIVIAIQHRDMLDEFNGSEDSEQEFIRNEVLKHIISPIIPPDLMDESTQITVNGTGRFADPGGPHADAGITGRKIIVDTYGGRGRHGGGAFSGKDASKVDRSAAYASRYAAKHVVASGLAKECEIQIAYAIGVAEPVGVRVDTFGTGSIPDSEISDRVRDSFDFRPGMIIQDLGLKRPIFSITADGGHFGRRVRPDGSFPWEELDDAILDRLRSS